MSATGGNQGRSEFRNTLAQLEEFAGPTPTGILAEDASRHVLGCSRVLCELFNIAGPACDLVDSDSRELMKRVSGLFVDPAGFIDRVEEILAIPQLVSREELPLTDGRTLERDYIPIFENGGLAGHLWLYRDITVRMRALRDLSASEARFAAVFDAVPISIAIARLRDGKIIATNPGFTSIFGYTSEEAIGRTSVELGLTTQPERDRILAPVRHGNAIRRFATDARTKSGETKSIEVAAAPLAYAGEPCYVNVALDVTEQRRAAEALRESERRFETVFRAAPLAICLSSLRSGTFIDVNPAFESLLGYSRDEIIGHTSSELNLFASPISRPDAAQQITADGGLHKANVTMRTKAGETREIELSVALVELAGEQCLMAVADDFTERNHAQEARERSEERSRLLSEHSHDIIFRYRLQEPAGMEYISPSVTEVFGYTPEDYYANPSLPSLVVHGEDRELFDAMTTSGDAGPHTMRWVRKDGTTVWAELRNVGVRDGAGELIAIEGVVRDVTARRKAEEALELAHGHLEGRVERQMTRGNLYGLTFREFTVLHHVSNGQTDKQIAVQLGISPLTVHKHVASILAKMNADSRTEAGVRALREQLLD